MQIIFTKHFDEQFKNLDLKQQLDIRKSVTRLLGGAAMPSVDLTDTAKNYQYIKSPDGLLQLYFKIENNNALFVAVC